MVFILINSQTIALLLLSILIRTSIEKNFIFSIIISIYNTARYIDDSLGSVINQTIEFNKIQIILVNDGSTDESEEKCLLYKKKYPNNIIYIKLEHSGVSKARNVGLKYAEGRYINFLDSDDKFDKNVFKYILIFFKYYKNVNIIGCRLKFFESSESYHPLDYKFYRTRVSNLTEEYNCIHLMSSSTFFRYSLIKNSEFKEGVFTGEDTIFINNFLLLNPLIGFVREAIYFYRKRADSTSAVQNAVKNEDYYFSIIKSVDEYLIEKSKKLYNKIVPFIQFYLGYTILFRIAFPAYKYLDSIQLNKYYQIMQNILNQIEDKYILEQNILSLNEKFVALSQKYHRDLRDDILFQNDLLIYSGNILMNITKSRRILIWRIIKIENNNIILEGKDNCILKSDTYYYFCRIGNSVYYPKYYDYFVYDFITMYGNLDKGRMVVFTLPLGNNNIQTLQFFLSYNGCEIELFPSFGWFTHITNINNSYYISGEYIIKSINLRINIYQYNETLKQLFEEEYCEVLKKLKKNNIIKLRKDYFNYDKIFEEKKNPIWIINDKQNLAGDNGEYFFRFLIKTNPKNLNFYFAIKKECTDYNRLKYLGNILELGSEIYLKNFLRADKIISSVYDSWAYNPFGNDRKYLIDLFHFDFIFIQHGIIKDDLSLYINRVTKNFSLIITSSNKEYKSILDNKYHYNFNNIILTGLPRFDNLQKLKKIINKEKIILVIPTWRMYIKGTTNSNTYESLYSHSFNSTDYFQFYNNLINDNELLINMKNYNYTGIFCLHPYFVQQWKDFKGNKIFTVLKNCDYQNLILKSSLLITDYSSIFFDFVYLNKPIIYSQFDYEEYINFHYPKGYFNYIKDGFGPVCLEIKCVIKLTILKMKNGCLMENKYLKRVKNFFKYIDNKNSERLYSHLIKNNIPKSNKKNFFCFYIIFFNLIIYKFNKKLYNINI